MGRPPGRSRGPGRPRGGGRLADRPAGRPAGRPRRTSNSTVASIDLGHVKYVPESTVLKPTSDADDSNWPCFVLKDTVVYRKAAHGQLEIANVCNVDLEGPFVIRGRLDVDMNEEHYLRDSSHRASYIEISANVMYSIGYGPWPVVWAAGKAGWFEINPAPEYEATYEAVCEGITLYYELMLAYIDARDRAGKGKRAKALQMPIEKLLFKCDKYAVSIGDGITLSEAKERCQTHAPFLLAHFSKELDINWNATSFKKWMTSENEELVQRLVESANKIPVPPEPAAKPPSPQSSTVDAKIEPQDDSDALPSLRASSTESDRSKRSKSRASKQSQESNVRMKDAKPTPTPKRVETPVHQPLPGQVPSAPGARSHNPPALPANPATMANLSTLFAYDGTGDASSQPQDPIEFLKELLEEILAEAQGDPFKVREGTVHSKMYMKCSIQYPACKEVTHFYAKQLVASVPSKWYGSPFFTYLKEQRTKPWQPGLLTPQTVPLQLVRRKKNPRAPRSRIPQASTTTRPGQGAGKHFPGTPRPSPALRPGHSAKRPIFYGDDDEDGRPRKHTRTSSDFDSEKEDESDEQELNDSDEDNILPQNNILTAPLPAVRKETVRLVIHADKIPSMSPSGPNGTWKCEEEGCNYIVRSAEEPQGKELIDRHFEDHADRAKRIDLALAEGTRGHLPINHLLEKIRSLGEAAQERDQTSLDGTKLPNAIKRRLLV